ncbi:MAG TPA: hypothetical protein VFA75_11685 [Nevskia sp.]|jgi:hypothetical protein|nr:hypothetical protein [Nevskia sp.]
METERSEADRELHAELIELIRPEAPSGWIIVLIRADAGSAEELVLEHIDYTGHVLWHDSSVELRRALHRVLRRHREGTGAGWSHASLVLSEAKLLSADFR